LQLNCVILLSTSAFKFNLHRYSKDQENFQLIVITHDMQFAQLLGRGSHSFPIQLNLSSSDYRMTRLNS
jgi:hypothetical protein